VPPSRLYGPLADEDDALLGTQPGIAEMRAARRARARAADAYVAIWKCRTASVGMRADPNGIDRAR
jgi:hypothetical protein